MSKAPTQIQPQSLTRLFVRGESLYVFWGFVSRGIGFFNSIIIISSLTIYQYGVFQLILSLEAIASTIVALGASVCGNEVMRYIGEGKESHAKKLFAEYGIIRITASLIVAALFFVIPFFLTPFYKSDFISMLQLLSILMLCELGFALTRGILGTKLKLSLIARRSSVQKVGQFAMLVIFLFTTHVGVREVLISLIVGYAISVVLLVRPAYREWRAWDNVHPIKERLLANIFRAHGKWDIAFKFFITAPKQLMPWLIKLLTGSTDAVAIFSLAQSMVGMVDVFSPNKTIGSLFPLRAADKEATQRIFSLSLKYRILSLLGFVLAAYATAGPLIRLFFEEYVASLPYFYVLLPTILISAFTSTIINFLIVYRRQKFLFMQRVFTSIAAIGLYFVTIPPLGLWGLILHAYIISFLTLAIFIWYIQRRDIDVKLRPRDLFIFDTRDRVFVASLWRELRGPLARIMKYGPFSKKFE
jgi:O-antigen/teichoic acid export membrane protein